MIDLLPLALRAMIDDAACQVLGDAIIESGWSDKRVTTLVRHECWNRTRGARKRLIHLASRPNRMFATAVAAVLLFGLWSRRTWPLIDQMNKRDRFGTIYLNGVAVSDLQPVAVNWSSVAARKLVEGLSEPPQGPSPNHYTFNITMPVPDGALDGLLATLKDKQ